VYSFSFARRGALALVGAVALAGATTASPHPAGAVNQTVCRSASLPRQRTEVNTDVALPRFDPSLGTLLSVSVPSQTIHLDTDARFQNTAQSSVVFSEDMHYTFTLTSPGGLASPSPLVGMIPRIPPTTLAPFSGTLDYQGPSAVTEPPTSRDAAAAPVSSSDPGVLATFTGPGTLGFHVQSAIAEVFNGGGGNVSAEINTFVAASVQVCYTYGVPEVSAAPPTVTPAATPSAAPSPPVVAPAPFTG
jgi:hypothetical protein